MGQRLGQHFLHDPAILERIVEAIHPTANDMVLEVGPGLGTLTRALQQHVRSVVCIERDEALAARLLEGGWGEGATVRIEVGDALAFDWHALVSGGPFKVAGNIPYAITSPLIEKALTPPLPVCVVYLVQKEVADRAAAEPGSKTYGALSVGVQAVARVERLFTVRAGAFRPPPAVDSAVLRLTPLATPLVHGADRARFRRFVTGLFGQRRKQLVRGLRAVAPLGRSEAIGLLERADIAPTARPETLSPDALVQLFGLVRALTDDGEGS